MAHLARRRLSTQASNASSERIFPKARLIINRKRMVLTPNHVDELSLLGWVDFEKNMQMFALIS